MPYEKKASIFIDIYRKRWWGGVLFSVLPGKKKKKGIVICIITKTHINSYLQHIIRTYVKKIEQLLLHSFWISVFQVNFVQYRNDGQLIGES